MLDSGTSEEGQFWRRAAILLWLIAFSKGIREPNDWAYTQALVDYGNGFTRRGFFGSVMKTPLGLAHYSHFAAVATVLTLALFATLGALSLRSSLNRIRPSGEMILALSASSYAVTYIAHVSGYLEIPLALLCALPLFFDFSFLKISLVFASTFIGILVHEQFAFVFLPVLLFSLATDAHTSTGRSRAAAWLAAALLSVLGLVETLFVAARGSLQWARVEALHSRLSLSTDHVLSNSFFWSFGITAGQSLSLMKSVWSRPSFYEAQAESLLLFAPTAAILIMLTIRILTASAQPKRWLLISALLASASPLALNAFGWDKSRWNTLVVLNSFMVLLIACRKTLKPIYVSVQFRQLCLIVMLLNMASGGSLLDGRRVRPFPFLRADAGEACEIPDRISELRAMRKLQPLLNGSLRDFRIK